MQSAESFVDSFVYAFSRRSRSNLIGESYFVLTSAADDEMSFEDQVGDRIMGLFTSHLVLGCGYDVSGERSTDLLLADSNGNGVLTLNEIFQYVRRSLIAEGQHVRVYPSNCSWLGFLRK